MASKMHIEDASRLTRSDMVYGLCGVYIYYAWAWDGKNDSGIVEKDKCKKCLKVRDRAFKIARVGATIRSTLVYGADGKTKYWSCASCNTEVEHHERCKCCGKTLREKV